MIEKSMFTRERHRNIKKKHTALNCYNYVYYYYKHVFTPYPLGDNIFLVYVYNRIIVIEKVDLTWRNSFFRLHPVFFETENLEPSPI